jgi:hypothetical protein
MRSLATTGLVGVSFEMRIMIPLLGATGRELLACFNELPNKERGERESRDRNRPDSQNRPYNRCDN